MAPEGQGAGPGPGMPGAPARPPSYSRSGRRTELPKRCFTGRSLNAGPDWRAGRTRWWRSCAGCSGSGRGMRF